MKLLSRLQKRLKPIMKRRLLVSIGIIGAILFLLVMYLPTNSHTRNKSPHNRPSSMVSNSGTVSEKPIPHNYKWKGGPYDPKYLKIPTINVAGFIVKVGLTKDKAIDVPPSVNLVGWYSGSASPGSPGVSVIDGHVDGYTVPGIFNRLKDLHANDRFTVELGNGTINTYRVMDNVTVKNASALSVLFSQKPKVASQLNLITCGGIFDTKTETYDQRVIVSAELIDQ